MKRSEFSICKTEDGDDWILGEGNFGTVRLRVAFHFRRPTPYTMVFMLRHVKEGSSQSLSPSDHTLPHCQRAMLKSSSNANTCPSGENLVPGLAGEQCRRERGMWPLDAARDASRWVHHYRCTRRCGTAPVKLR